MVALSASLTRPESIRTSPLFQALRDPDRLVGRCGNCEFRMVCGGSRSRAFGATGDLLAEEPWCTYQPGSFPFARVVQDLLGAGAASAKRLRSAP